MASYEPDSIHTCHKNDILGYFRWLIPFISATSSTRMPLTNQQSLPLLNEGTCDERMAQLVGDIFIGHEVSFKFIGSKPNIFYVLISKRE